MQRPMKTLALTAAVTAALVSASAQAETYVCDWVWGAHIFKRSDDGKAFHRPASKGQYGEDPRADYTTLRETDEDIWLYKFFRAKRDPRCDDSEFCGAERDIMTLFHISKRYLSYFKWDIQGYPVGEEGITFGDKYVSCTVIP